MSYHAEKRRQRRVTVVGLLLLMSGPLYLWFLELRHVAPSHWWVYTVSEVNSVIVVATLAGGPLFTVVVFVALYILARKTSKSLQGLITVEQEDRNR